MRAQMGADGGGEHGIRTVWQGGYVSCGMGKWKSRTLTPLSSDPSTRWCCNSNEKVFRLAARVSCVETSGCEVLLASFRAGVH